MLLHLEFRINFIHFFFINTDYQIWHRVGFILNFFLIFGKSELRYSYKLFLTINTVYSHMFNHFQEYFDFSKSLEYLCLARTQQENLRSIMKNTKIEADVKQVRLVSPGTSFDIVYDYKCQKLPHLHLMATALSLYLRQSSGTLCPLK